MLDFIKENISNLSHGDFSAIRNNAKYIRNKIYGYPNELLIEPTNICNLKCVLCPTSGDFMERSRGFMKFDNFRRIVNNIKGIVPEVILFFSGEPFLNKDIFKMIKYCSKQSIKTKISTNATVLDKGNAEKLLKSGLGKIVVSFDGLSKQTYEKYRVGADFDRVYENIRNLCSRKRELGLRKPLIQLQFIVMKHNEHELPMLEQVRKELGVDSVQIKSVVIPTWFYEGRDAKRIAKKYLPRGFSRYKSESLEISKPQSICEYVRKCVILWDGRVCLCCYDVDGAYCFGNAISEEFTDIWNSSKYKHARAMIKKRELALCKKCGAAISIVKKV